MHQIFKLFSCFIFFLCCFESFTFPPFQQLQDDEGMLHSDLDRPSELSDIAEESETEISDEVIKSQKTIRTLVVH